MYKSWHAVLLHKQRKEYKDDALYLLVIQKIQHLLVFFGQQNPAQEDHIHRNMGKTDLAGI